MPEFLHFRSNADLDKKLEDEVQRLLDKGTPPALANKSVVARTLLMASLDAPKKARSAVLEAVLEELDGALEVIVRDSLKTLPAKIKAHLAAAKSR